MGKLVAAGCGIVLLALLLLVPIGWCSLWLIDSIFETGVNADFFSWKSFQMGLLLWVTSLGKVGSRSKS